MPVPDSAIRKQCGNSAPVTMIQAVARQTRQAMAEEPITLNGKPFKITGKQLEVLFEP